MTEDEVLLRQYVKTNSEQAFADLVHRHLGMVYGAASQHLEEDSHLAEDVAQKVFVLMARKARALCSHPSLAGWLYRTAYNQASETRRAERRRKCREEVAAVDSPTMNDPNNDDKAADSAKLVGRLILQLSHGDREVVLLRYMETCSYADIATRLRITEGAAHKRTERAIEKMRRKLIRWGIYSTFSALEAGISAQTTAAVPANLAANVVRAAMASGGPAMTTIAINLMTATKTTIALTALAGIIAAGLAVHETTASRQAAAKLAATTIECSRLSALLDRLDRRLQSAKMAEASIKPSNSGDAARDSASAIHVAARQTASKSPTSSASQTALELEKNPDVRAALAKLVAWNNAAFFGSLFRSAGLSDAQVQRAEYLIGQLENFEGFGPNGLTLRTDDRPSADIRAELVQLIGVSGAESLAQYLIVRQVTDGLAGNLYATEAPLSEQQASQLNQILADNNAKPAPTGGWDDPGKTNWPTALAQAAAFLSPQQLSALKDLAISQFGADLQ